MKYLRDPTMLFAFGLMTVILMMILPVPSWILDLGLAASFAIAILMFTTALFADRPLDFSSFPTVLIASLMLRLALNISSTKLIISQGHEGSNAAGSVIEGFATFIMGGSVVLGLIVFCVLLIVNFVVITKGATRMAEVGARFALDGMPGKQLAIDSDVAAGAINHEEARSRRETELAETTFFGSLDGASKFVKGDAIAGLLITVLNLVAGLSVGLIVHGMPLLEAMENFAVLTVGDGLVSQIPAVIISIASALLLARGGAKGKIDATILVQIGSNPISLSTVAIILLTFAVVPGLPFLPFFLGSAAAAFAAWRTYRRQANASSIDESAEIDLPAPKRSIGDILDLEDISVTFAHDLVGLALDPTRGLESRIEGMRNHIAKSFGVVLPDIRLTDDSSLAPGTYVIRIQGVEMARDKLRPGHILVLKSAAPLPAIVGIDVAEPVYGAPARWVLETPSNRDSLADLTAVSPDEVLATHLMEVVKSAFPQLIGVKALNRILDSYREVSDPTRASENRRFLDDFVPNKVPYDTLISVMRLLLVERISIRNLPVIVETIAEGREAKMSPELISEFVRQRLGLQIISSLRRADGLVPLIQLSSVWEDIFQRHQSQGNVFDVTLPPDVAKKFRKRVVDTVAKTAEDGNFAGIITSARRRRFVFNLLRDTGISNPVISYDEIDPSIRPSLVGSVAA